MHGRLAAETGFRWPFGFDLAGNRPPEAVYGWWWHSMVASNQHKQGDRDAVHPAIEWVSEYDWQKSFCNYREMTTEIIDILVAQEILTKLLPDKITDKDDDEIWWWNLKHTWMT